MFNIEPTWEVADCVRMRIEDIELCRSILYAKQTESFLQFTINRFNADTPLFEIHRNQIQSLLNAEARRLKADGRDMYSVNRIRIVLHSLFDWVINRYELHDKRNPVSVIKAFSVRERTKIIPN